MVKQFFFWNDAKNIDIWILRKEQNLFRSEFYMCVPSLDKIDWEISAKNPRWPTRNWVFWHFNIRPRWFPAHHRDRHVEPYVRIYKWLRFCVYFYWLCHLSDCSIVVFYWDVHCELLRRWLSVKFSCSFITCLYKTDSWSF